MKKVVLKTVFFFAVGFLNAQDGSNDKSAGIGFSGTMSFNSRVPGMAVTPYGFFKFSQNEIFMGMDIYPATGFGNVLGFQAGYNYTFYEVSKGFNLFGNVTLQYTKFGNGEGPYVPYNFLPTDSAKERVNLVRTKTFLNTFALGANFKIVKKLGMQIMIGGGYNSYASAYSPTNTGQLKIYQFDTGSKMKLIGFGKLAITYKIWKSAKRVLD